MPSASGNSAWAGGHPPLREFLRESRERIEALYEAIRVLPEVDENGQSECPFAEKLYAQMERQMEDVQWRDGVLHQRLAETEGEIRRCERNRGIVADHHRRLHGATARDHYGNADDLLARQHRTHLQDRDEILAVLKAVEDALEASYGRLFPGRKPKDGPEPSQALRTVEAGPARPVIDNFTLDRDRMPPIVREREGGTSGSGDGVRGRPPGASEAFRSERSGPRQAQTPSTVPRGELADVLSLETQRGRGRPPASAPPRSVPGGPLP